MVTEPAFDPAIAKMMIFLEWPCPVMQSEKSKRGASHECLTLTLLKTTEELIVTKRLA